MAAVVCISWLRKSCLGDVSDGGVERVGALLIDSRLGSCLFAKVLFSNLCISRRVQNSDRLIGHPFVANDNSIKILKQKNDLTKCFWITFRSEHTVTVCLDVIVRVFRFLGYFSPL